MSQQELVKLVVEALTELGIDYMMTGSVVSSLQGEPRSSHDVDLVIVMRPDAIAGMVQAFPPPNYFLSEEAIRDALQHRSMFNLLSLNDGEKVDFWILTDEPFDQSRFARKRLANMQGLELQVSAPEDTILMKLRWARMSGGSEKQFTDALRVYEVQGNCLDQDYMNHWAIQLGIEDLWQRVRTEAEQV